MLREIGTLFTERWDFFAGLLWEHLLISLIAILIAVVIGGLAGILISEFQKAAKPTLGVINFLYTIPSISMLGFLIPFSGVGICLKNSSLTVSTAGRRGKGKGQHFSVMNKSRVCARPGSSSVFR